MKEINDEESKDSNVQAQIHLQFDPPILLIAPTDEAGYPCLCY